MQLQAVQVCRQFLLYIELCFDN